MDDRRWWRELPLGLVALIVAAIYFSRIDTLPIVGEEGRWARGAVQMIESGDWVVPRQQGQVFPERPPMSSWAMAAAGWLRGEIDAVAIRLPSVLAVLATAILIYAYSRAFLTQLGAAAAALAYATGGQVLQIGRHGESEALFAFFLSAALLLWHYGLVRRWSPLGCWLAGYSCMALAALVKGPQAPAYFVAVTVVYALIIRRDWRLVFGWSHAAGIAAAALIVSAWQIPYFLMTDWDSVVATWAGLAADRFELRGLLEHVAQYPLETFACLLPWSPLVIAFSSRSFRASLRDASQLTSFLMTALVITYPTVWFASAARGRYYMPLYPCVAIMIGLAVERCVASPAGSWGRRHWRNFLYGTATAAAVGGGVVAVASFIRQEAVAALAQPAAFAVFFLISAVAAAAILVACGRRVTVRSGQIAVFVLAAFAGLSYTGVVINVHASRWNDPADVVAQIKQHLPPSQQLVSFGPVDFRFCFHYQQQVQELPWPMALDEVPEGVEYFCIDHHPSDTAASRLSGRGRSWTTGPGTLPFEWEEVGQVCVERRLRDQPQPKVIVARIKRPAGVRTAASDARPELPQPAVAR